jgi:hypothetical protein
MLANQLLQVVTHVLFVVVFISAAARAVRQPLRANVDIALLLGEVFLIMLETWGVLLLQSPPPCVLTSVSSSLLMPPPVLQLRLVHDFARVRPILMRFAEVGLLASVICLFLTAPPLPVMPALAMVTDLVALQAYISLCGAARCDRPLGRSQPGTAL